ncbi:hypothetical protein R6Q57_008745 [Mikania cordata]
MIPWSPITTDTTSYATAPSTPNRFYSVPTRPADDYDFAFDFSGQLQPPSISDADELFYCGKIKTLKLTDYDQINSPTSRFIQAFSPPYGDQKQAIDQNPPKRGREATTSTTRTRDKVSRSSSPFRISDILTEQDTTQKNSLTWYNKWNLKNLLLFRSTSEGSARRRKDPVNKYSRIRDEDVKNLSFRSTHCCSSGVGSSRRKVSAHEKHYTMNRAVAEEMRRKTYLPYKSGLLGCLGFHNNGAGGSVHEISRGITSVTRQRQV